MKKVYTKTGDKGQTGLITGERLSKSSLIFEVLGTLDEFNASLGKVVANYDDDLIEELEDFDLKAGDQVFDQAVSQKIFLIELQRELFNLGAEIAQSPKVKISNDLLSRIEERIDKLQSLMDKDWQSKFVLPGGSELSAEVDLARTVCRRLERRLVALDGERDIRDVSLKIINRVSDYLFVLRTWINKVLKVEENIYQSL
jgi:cob(I)alamin adenosyltransferase